MNNEQGNYMKRFALIIPILLLLSSCLHQNEVNSDLLAQAPSQNSIEDAVGQTEVHQMVMDHFNSEGSKRKKALVIGLDGTRPDAFIKAGGLDLMNYSDNSEFFYSYAGGKRDDGTKQMTFTAAGWTTILTGVWSKDHGVTTNTKVNKKPEFKTFSQKVIDSKEGRRAAVCAAWEALTEGSTNGDKDVIRYCPDDGYYTGDYPSKDPRVVSKMIELIKDDVDSLFCVIDFTDHTGHKNKFSPADKTYVSEIGRAIEMAKSMIDEAITSSLSQDEDWLIIITTDHGGIGRMHGGQSLSEKLTFIINMTL